MLIAYFEALVRHSKDCGHSESPQKLRPFELSQSAFLRTDRLRRKADAQPHASVGAIAVHWPAHDRQTQASECATDSARNQPASYAIKFHSRVLGNVNDGGFRAKCAPTHGAAV
jgi:hypothetical protein